MLNIVSRMIPRNPVIPPLWRDAGLCGFRSVTQQSCLVNHQNTWQLNFTAMRDQNFQDQSTKLEQVLLNGPLVSSPLASASTPTSSRRELIEDLKQQQAFSEYLKRKLPSQKPSSEFIQSLKDRINIL